MDRLPNSTARFLRLAGSHHSGVSPPLAQLVHLIPSTEALILFKCLHTNTGMVRRAEWVERMRTQQVLAVAQGLGLEVQSARGSSGGAFSCPACNAERRHTKTRDKRGAAGVRKDGHGWRCFQCDAAGDALDLVAYRLGDNALSELRDTRKAEVREWCVRWLGLDGSPPSSRTLVAPLTQPELSRQRQQQPLYPPIDETSALWTMAGPVDTSTPTMTWLRESRGLDATAVAELDLARVLLRDAGPLPRWAGFGGSEGKPWRSWPSVGLQLVVPLYDANGSLRSVLFRRCFETADPWPPKSMGTNGFGRAGLVMANAAALELLARPTDRADGMSIVIEEGETDWLTGCLAWARKNERPIFGVTSGAWTPEIARSIPIGARVTIRTDNDEAGDLLANKIAKTLQEKCTVLRGGRKAG